MNTNRIFLIGFSLVVGIGAYYDMTCCHELPWPPRFIATGIVFGLLDLLSFVNEELAGVMAAGIVLAYFLKTLDNKKKCGQTPDANQFGPTSCTHGCGTAQPAYYTSLSPTVPLTTA